MYIDGSAVRAIQDKTANDLSSAAVFSADLNVGTSDTEPSRLTDSAPQNIIKMIHSFKCPDTGALFRSRVVRRFANFERVARRKLLQLHAATELASLRIPPGNQLEGLKGDRRGQHSIRINDQWRICFVWHDDGAHDVEIVDYH